MCGILGSINLSFEKSTLDLLLHRGPDSFGLKKIKVGKTNITFGHRRLSILDLSPAGNQPMISECGKYAIIFNGEIYNHLTLRKRLKQKDFKGHSDTETILYYLIEKGINGVEDFNGIFAFGFLDLNNNKLYIVRDPFGVKPLYYSTINNSFIFSSEIRPIKQLLNKDEISIENLGVLLKLRFIPSPCTLHNRIQKVLPGEIIEVGFDGNKCIKKTHTSFLKPIPSERKITFSKAVKEYGCFITNAVERQLMSDVEIGILLSGGVDSAVVASIAQQKSKTPLKAFTVGFEGNYSEDEVSAAKVTADQLGLDHYITRMNFNDFLGVFEKITSIIEEPLATTSVIPMYFLSELASKYVKVVLTGQGADEPLGGYRRYQGELLQKYIPGLFLKGIEIGVNKGWLKQEKIIRAKNTFGIKNDVQRFLSTYSIFTNSEIYDLINVKESKSIRLLSEIYNMRIKDKKHQSVKKMMAIDSVFSLADDLLLYTDKITMNFSLECRVPMLDHELVAFIESLPAKYRVKIGSTKIIHKKYSEQILPDTIIKRKKRGFQSPTKTWFKDNINIIKELLLDSKSNFSTIFNLSSVDNVLKNHLKGYNKEKQIFLLLSIYFWLKQINYK